MLRLNRCGCASICGVNPIGYLNPPRRISPSLPHLVRLEPDRVQKETVSRNARKTPEIST